jgi:nucleoside phosphorylase
VRSLAIICGLKSEAAVIGRALAAVNAGERAGVWVTGADAQRAEDMARTAIEEDEIAAMLSVGVSGALSPALRPGDLLIGGRVASERGERFDCDAALISMLKTALSPPAHQGESRDPEPLHALHQSLDPGFRRDERKEVTGVHFDAVLLGADSIIASAEDKARLFASYGAVAVDMESHGAARAAKAADVPFAAIRAIADPAGRALPKAALGAVAMDGSTRVIATLLKCAKAPGDFPALLLLGRDSGAALKTLGRSLDRLLGGLLLGLDL